MLEKQCLRYNGRLHSFRIAEQTCRHSSTPTTNRNWQEYHFKYFKNYFEAVGTLTCPSVPDEDFDVDACAVSDERIEQLFSDLSEVLHIHPEMGRFRDNDVENGRYT